MHKVTPADFAALVRANNHAAQHAAIAPLNEAERIHLACGLCALKNPAWRWIDSYNFWLRMWTGWNVRPTLDLKVHDVVRAERVVRSEQMEMEL